MKISKVSFLPIGKAQVRGIFTEFCLAKRRFTGERSPKSLAL